MTVLIVLHDATGYVDVIDWTQPVDVALVSLLILLRVVVYNW